MAEIAILRIHIVNYAKTRDTYGPTERPVTPRDSEEEHEEEILLHQAAKMPLTIWGSKAPQS